MKNKITAAILLTFVLAVAIWIGYDHVYMPYVNAQYLMEEELFIACKEQHYAEEEEEETIAEDFIDRDAFIAAFHLPDYEVNKTDSTKHFVPFAMIIGR